MAAIDYDQIVTDSIAAAKAEVGKAWKKLKPYAEHEFRQFAEDAVFLATLKLKGTIDDKELLARVALQKTALTNVLLAIEGIGLVTAQNVVNAVISVVANAVKKAVEVILPIPL